MSKDNTYKDAKGMIEQGEYVSREEYIQEYCQEVDVPFERADGKIELYKIELGDPLTHLLQTGQMATIKVLQRTQDIKRPILDALDLKLRGLLTEEEIALLDEKGPEGVEHLPEDKREAYEKYCDQAEEDINNAESEEESEERIKAEYDMKIQHVAAHLKIPVLTTAEVRRMPVEKLNKLYDMSAGIPLEGSQVHRFRDSDGEGTL